MEQLRIHRLKYRNRGMANKSLKGQQEYYVIFKFDIDEKAKSFVSQVKEFWYARKSVKDKVINIINDDKTDMAQKPVQRRKPGPQKGQGGRPTKKNLQGQGR